MGGTAASAGQPAAPSPLARALEAETLHRHLPVPLSTPSDSDGVLLSPQLSDGLPITEALPSWNVTSRAPFEVDIRVRTADDPWSPWMRIGDWNVPKRDGEVATTFEHGRVAVDVLRLVKPMEAAQLRLSSLDPTRPLRSEEVSLHVVLSDLRDVPETLSATATAAWPRPVKHVVPARSQRQDGGRIGHRICSPTSVAMVSSFHGFDVPTVRMAEVIRDPHHDIYGNWNRAVQGAHSYGVRGQLVRLSSWNAVAAILETGAPLIASIRADEGQLRGAPYDSTQGHLLVVTGLAEDGWVHVNDPAARRPEEVPRVYAREDLEKVWLEGGGVAYVLEGAAADATP